MRGLVVGDGWAPPAAAVAAAGGGIVPWWPGCFAGDDVSRSIEVDVTVSTAAVAAIGDGDVAITTAAVSEAFECVNGITEPQMHVRFVVASVVVAATTCSNTGDVPAVPTLPETAAPLRHLFDHCPDSKWGGYAFIGTLCDPKLNLGVTHVGGNTCLTLAHELGHSLGASHTFANNDTDVGEIGGVMDYERPLAINGVAQFDSGASKASICAGLGVAAAESCGLGKSTPIQTTTEPHVHYVDDSEGGGGVAAVMVVVALLAAVTLAMGALCLVKLGPADTSSVFM